MNRLYLDHNATTVIRPEARNAMVAALERYGAASSVHGEGRAVRRLIEEARDKVAALVGAEARNVVFVSGASEANATALTPYWTAPGLAAPLARCLVSGVEHVSVLQGARFDPQRIERLAVDADGRAAVGAWAERLAACRQVGERPLVSLMLANNETGVIQPVREVAEITHAAGGLCHSDAAQAAGKIDVSMAALQVDLLTVSSHKLGGPQGVGALILASDQLRLTEPLLRGGGQERGLRAGTENVAAIAGFGAAAVAAKHSLAASAAHQEGLKRTLEAALTRAGATIVAAAVPRLPNTTAFAQPGLSAETALMALDLAGVAVSSGSACSSGKVGASHVLLAMGLDPAVARATLRVSLGATTTAEDIERFLAVWNGVRDILHKSRGARAA